MANKVYTKRCSVVHQHVMQFGKSLLPYQGLRRLIRAQRACMRKRMWSPAEQRAGNTLELATVPFARRVSFPQQSMLGETLG